MATDFDPYRILEVDSSAGQEQIDEAYRRHWAAYPRDAAPEARLREIQAAYRILGDPAERRSYDERRASAVSAPTAVAEMPTFEPEPPRATDAPLWGLSDIGKAIAVIIAIVIVASIPIYVVAAQIAGSSDQIDKDPTALSVVLIVSALFQVSALGTAWWFGVRKYKLDFRALGFRKPERGWPWLPFTLVGGAMAIVIVYSVALSAVGIEPDTDLPDAVYDNIVPLTIALILTTVMAPFVEEVFFRGFVYGGLTRRWGWIWGAIGSGLLFGAAHLANAGYFYVVPPIIGIGIMFAWAYHYSRSLYTSMAAHFLFNLIQMIAVLASR
jgi:membrane protease YdiL (CAAX protease family)